MAMIAPINDELVAAWASGLQDRLGNEWIRQGNVGDAPLIELQHGPRYIRIVRKQGSSTSAYGFIDRDTGLIYKAASWKAPAKGPRGSVHNVMGRRYEGCTLYGMAYAR